jgi:hypothetical protein
MDWSDEYKLCFIDHHKQSVILGGTWYVDNKKKDKMKMLILLLEKYNRVVDLIERIMRDLHTSFHRECQIAKKLSGHS